jgi:16S rRNA (guanine966-N2)-methyltransferase
MRVIGGEHRSRRLKTLHGTRLRPTPDRLRETLFDVLAPRIAGTVFVDAYAGSGAVGIEALSRGASRVVLIDRSKSSIAVIRENVLHLGIARRVDVVHSKAAASLANYPADIVFLDPPYDLLTEYDACFEALSEKPPPLVIAEHSSRVSLKPSYGALVRTRVLKQGDSSLSFYSPASSDPPECGESMTGDVLSTSL